jgi:hypothetical protein
LIACVSKGRAENMKNQAKLVMMKIFGVRTYLSLLSSYFL